MKLLIALMMLYVRRNFQFFSMMPTGTTGSLYLLPKKVLAGANRLHFSTTSQWSYYQQPYNKVETPFILYTKN